MSYFNFQCHRVDALHVEKVTLLTDVDDSSFIRSHENSVNLTIDGAGKKIDVFANMPWEVVGGNTPKWAVGPGNITFKQKQLDHTKFELETSSVVNDEIDREQNVTLKTTVPEYKEIYLTIHQEGQRIELIDSAGNGLVDSQDKLLLALK